MKGVVLYPFSEEHLENTFKWIQDSKLRRSFNFNKDITWENHIKWYERMIINDNEKHFAIKLLGTGEHIGNCGLKKIDRGKSCSEIWIYMGEDINCGKGYGKAAATKLVQYAFNELEMKMLYLYVEKINIAAKKLYEKVGFELKEMPANNVWNKRGIPHFYMEMTSED